MKLKSAGFFENKLTLFLFLFIPTLLLYAKSLSYGFTPLDEKWLILDREAYLHTAKSWPESFTIALYDLYYRPLLSISILIDFTIAGLSPYFYHVTNLIWHLASVFCLLKLLLLFRVPVDKAAWLSLLFALHPMAVHAVAWVPGRNDLMLCTFTLGSLIFLKQYLDTEKKLHLFWHLFLFVCALLTKENAVALPLLFLVMAWEKRAYLAAVLAFMLSGLWLLVRNQLVPASLSSPMPLAAQVQNFFSGLLVYTGKAVFPFYQSVHPGVEPVLIVFGGATFALIVLSFFRPGMIARSTAVAGLILFFLLLIVPLWFSAGRSNGELYEHRLYTSLAGFILFVSQLRFDLSSKKLKLTLAAIASFFFAKTFFRMNVYQSADVFLTQAVKEQPGYFMFQAQYASYLSHVGRYEEAIAYYSKALAQRPDRHEYYNERGRAYFMTGNLKAAITDITAAINVHGFKMEYYLSRCAAYNAANETGKAMKDLAVLLECCSSSVPDFLRAEVSNKWMALLEALNRELSANPANDVALFRRACLYFDAGKRKQGFTDLQRALELSPQNLEYRQMYQEQLAQSP